MSSLEALLRYEPVKDEPVKDELAKTQLATTQLVATRPVAASSGQLVVRRPGGVMSTRGYPARHRRVSPVRRVISRTTSVLMVLGIALVAGCLAAVLLGYRPAVVMSGSMQPTLHVGDLVVTRAATVSSLHPGELVTFRNPAVNNAAVTHRVVSVDRAGKFVTVHTKGDANRVGEQWQVAAGTEIGRTVFHVRYAGAWLSALSSPIARTIAIVGAGLLIALALMRRIWQSNTTKISGRRTKTLWQTN